MTVSASRITRKIHPARSFYLSLAGIILLTAFTNGGAIASHLWLNGGMRILAQLGMADGNSAAEFIPFLNRAERLLDHAYHFQPDYPFLSARIFFARATLGLSLEKNENQSVTADPEALALFIRYGDQALLNKQITTALVWYQEATKAFPTHWKPWFKIGRIARIQQMPTREIQAYWKAISLQPNNRDIWYALGIVYEEQRNWAQALSAYQRGLSASHGHVGISNLYYRIGQSYQNMDGKSYWQDAWYAYAQAYAFNDFTLGRENLVNTMRRRGELMANRKRWVEAEVEYRRALNLDPDNYWVHIELAQVLWWLSRPEEAKTMLQSAIELNPQDANAYRYLGDYYRAEGDISNARATYLQLLRIEPDSEPTRRKLEALSD